MKQTFFIQKAFFKLWLANIFLYRRKSDKHEFSPLLSTTINELYYLRQRPLIHKEYQHKLIRTRNRIGHH